MIVGISGQDGAYLAQFLLKKGYEVWGTSRDARGSSFSNLKRLQVLEQVHLMSMVPEDFRSVIAALKKVQPQELYYLAGQSSVGLSFEEPAETMTSITLGTLNMLEACRMVDESIRLYHAGSGECFGNTDGQAANEQTPFRPRSPYAVAKSTAFWLVSNYREAYHLWACTGILFNHESPLRPARFVTQKIVSAAKRLATRISWCWAVWTSAVTGVGLRNMSMPCGGCCNWTLHRILSSLLGKPIGCKISWPKPSIISAWTGASMWNNRPSSSVQAIY
jgi:GDPmannose 4,6-dehydratase